MIVLPDTEDHTIVSLFVWTKHRNVTDGRTDRQTDPPWLLQLLGLPQRPLQSTHSTATSLVERSSRELWTLHPVESYWFLASQLQQASHDSRSTDQTTWNSLPPALRAPELAQNAFIRALKTHLFSSTWYSWDILRDSGAKFI